MIYFIRSPDGPIKIGTTMDLATRLKRLMSEHGDGLELLAVIDGNREVERALHRRFDDLRIVNEWFEPGDDLIGFIVAEGKPWDQEKGRDDVAVKIDRKLVGMARLLAARDNVTMAELLSGMLEGPIGRAYAKLVLESKAKDDGK